MEVDDEINSDDDQTLAYYCKQNVASVPKCYRISKDKSSFIRMLDGGCIHVALAILKTPITKKTQHETILEFANLYNFIV
ncbi:MAG TPA: hypothetical protein VJL60_04880, partial [Gammaproteobacteria bacterium]|nr:hypothetical protein [Gammaproteobacteria bacterium]